MTYQNSIDALEHTAKHLKGVTIECLNYAECISRYDSPETLFFCDPPYLNTERYYGKGNFTYDDHVRLAELLNGVKDYTLC
jgi:DNA adenine methylase